MLQFSGATSRKMHWWCRVVVSPNMHALHHSRYSERRNFGGTLMLWDWLFGTLTPIRLITAAEIGCEISPPKTNIFLEQLLFPVSRDKDGRILRETSAASGEPSLELNQGSP